MTVFIRPEVDLQAASATVPGLKGFVRKASAYRNGNQSLSKDTVTTVIFNTENYDTSSIYDTATGVITPDVAGLYLITWGVAIASETSASLSIAFSTLAKNSVEAARGSTMSNAANFFEAHTSTGSAIVEMNGTTDNLRINAFYSSTTTPTVIAGGQPHLTRFEITKLD
jgi:hypothetical protein